MDYIEEQNFENKDLSGDNLNKAEYESCRFVNCSFVGANLADFVFLECEFEQCDFSMATITNTAFREVQFFNCKLLGLDFSSCNKILFSVAFENCILNLASFHQLKMKATKFKSCSLQEVDFEESELQASVFMNCDLLNASFEYTNLEKADLRTSINYSIHPERNKIAKAKFDLPAVTGLLHHLNIVISS